MTKPKPKCVFCGGESKLTKEHIWGDWTRDYVPRSANKHSFANVKILKPMDRPPPLVRTRAGDPLSANVKVVCQPCNNGWMSNLQEKAKPYLIPLFRGEKVTLDHHAQAAVAAWATMATMSGENISRDASAVAISQFDREWLMKTSSPPLGWRNWVGKYQRQDWVGQWVHTTAIILPSEDIPAAQANNDLLPNTQTTTFTIGQLYIHAMSGPPSTVHGWEWQTAHRARGRLTQIQPPTARFIAFPRPPLTDSDAEGFSLAFMKFGEKVATQPSASTSGGRRDGASRRAADNRRRPV